MARRPYECAWSAQQRDDDDPHRNYETSYLPARPSHDNSCIRAQEVSLREKHYAQGAIDLLNHKAIQAPTRITKSRPRPSGAPEVCPTSSASMVAAMVRSMRPPERASTSIATNADVGADEPAL